MIGSVRETYHESFVRLCIGSLSMAYRIFNYAPQDDEKKKNKKYCGKNEVKAKKKQKISFAHKAFENALQRVHFSVDNERNYAKLILLKFAESKTELDVA